MHRNGKTLLVIGAGREAVPALQHAQALGYRVLATDGDPHAPGFAHCYDHSVVSTYDIAGTVAAAHRFQQHLGAPIDGVIALAADVPVTVATVAAALGLPGISLATAHWCSDKRAQKAALAAAGVPVPWYQEVESAEDVAFLMLTDSTRRPLVLKPVDARGARGVLRLPSVAHCTTRDIGWAYEHARSQSPTGRVMVEEWIPGPQLSTESVLHAGWAVTPAVVDRNYSRLDECAPYCIEDGGSWPTILSATDRAAVCAVAERAARALEIDNWTAKGDIVLSQDGPVAIEMAARLSGGLMSSIQCPLATHVDLVGAAIKLALGEPLTQAEVTLHDTVAVAIRYFWPVPGRVTAIHGVEEALMCPAVQFLHLAIHPGDVIAPITDHTQRAGCCICTGATRDDAVRWADAVVQQVVIETEAV